jgi:DNA-directed RNA polymerase specialized sigma24 family protein
MLLVFDELQRLDDTDRSIVGLTLAQGLKPGEIARALRLSPQVVRTRKTRAIKRLAIQLRAASSASVPPAPPDPASARSCR